MKDVAVVVKNALNSRMFDDKTVNEAKNPEDIKSFKDLSKEDFYDSAMNEFFGNYNSDAFIFDPKSNKIGFEVTVTDANVDNGEVAKVMLMADSLGKALEYYDIAVSASMQDVHEKFFRVSASNIVKYVWKYFIREVITDDADINAIEEHANDFFDNVVNPAENVKQMAEGIAKMSY